MKDSPAAASPRVSVVIPAYGSQETLARCLEGMLAQDLPSYEVVVVDSSPDEATAAVARRYPAVRFVRSPHRLLPHAARNEGARIARGELLVFTDPDIYPPPGWLRSLVAAHDAPGERAGEPIVGALACHGERWLDAGIHLCKFSKWLPGGPPRPVDMSPTANMLVSCDDFAAVGGFDGDQMQGDVTFSRQLLAAGHTLWFEPAAAVAHHHLSSFADFLRERYWRGIEFGDLRGRLDGLGRRRSLLYLAVSLSPLRLGRITLLVVRHAARAGLLAPCVATSPVWMVGHAASLLGESRSYLRAVIGPRRRDAGMRGRGRGGRSEPVQEPPAAGQGAAEAGSAQP